jgi:hypothetical protein
MAIYRNGPDGQTLISVGSSPVVKDGTDEHTLLPVESLLPGRMDVTLSAAFVALNEHLPGVLSVRAPQPLAAATVVMGLFDGLDKHEDTGWRVSSDRKSFEIWFPTDPAERDLWLSVQPTWSFVWYPSF